MIVSCFAIEKCFATNARSSRNGNRVGRQVIDNGLLNCFEGRRKGRRIHSGTKLVILFKKNKKILF